ncbi:hypothetical protein D3C71_2139110 [compost metagenome]
MIAPVSAVKNATENKPTIGQDIKFGRTITDCISFTATFFPSSVSIIANVSDNSVPVIINITL